MTIDPNDGAFPLEIKHYDLNGAQVGTTTYTGLTKREYLIGELLKGAANFYGTQEEIQMVVSRAFAIADEIARRLNEA